MLISVDKCALLRTNCCLRENLVAKNKRKSITVILREDEYRRFQGYCASRGYKKSTLLARLMRDHLDSEKFMTESEGPPDRNGGK
jgi:hypothetical protein